MKVAHRFLLLWILVAMSALASAAECRKTGTICVDTSPTKAISGVSFSLADVGGCWRWRDTYQCVGSHGSTTGTCDSFEARNCQYVSDSCTQFYPAPFDEICERRAFTYSCPSGSPQTVTTNDCATRLGCTTNADGTQNCIDAGHPNDSDFGRAMVAMEVGREAGVYRKGLNVFSGISKTCRSKNMGFSTDCCDTSGGARSNASVMTGSAFSGLTGVAGDVLSYGWKNATDVCYDLMFQSDAPWMVEKAVAAWGQQGALGWQPNANFTTEIGMGGMVLSYGESAAGIAGSISQGLEFLTGSPLSADLLGAISPTELVSNMFGVEGLSLSFDPVSFGFTMALTVYQSLTACDEEEMKLGMMRGANLCVSGGEECDDGGLFGLFKSCTQYYCCYNSKLARIINEQGLPQLGRQPGRDCQGFTDTDIGRLDWDRINMSEFVNDMVRQAQLPDAAAIQSKAPAVVEKLRNYYAPN